MDTCTTYQTWCTPEHWSLGSNGQPAEQVRAHRPVWDQWLPRTAHVAETCGPHLDELLGLCDCSAHAHTPCQLLWEGPSILSPEMA